MVNQARLGLSGILALSYMGRLCCPYLDVSLTRKASLLEDGASMSYRCNAQGRFLVVRNVRM